MDAAVQLREALQKMPELIGERLCLDFANTVEPRGGLGTHHTSLRDYLTGYTDLIAWGYHAHLLTEELALHLLSEAEQRPGDAQIQWERAIALRETVYRVFWLVANHEQPSQADLDSLRQEYLAAVKHSWLVKQRDRFVWQWEEDDRALDQLLWPIAQSATTLLTDEDLERIKVCPGVPGDLVLCAWLFFDTSKNRNRQWCSMADCGSIVKARRLTERRRAARAGRATQSS
jgi:predicted RNA-binding Zn ribbon-like protein